MQYESYLNQLPKISYAYVIRAPQNTVPIGHKKGQLQVILNGIKFLYRNTRHIYYVH